MGVWREELGVFLCLECGPPLCVSHSHLALKAQLKSHLLLDTLSQSLHLPPLLALMKLSYFGLLGFSHLYHLSVLCHILICFPNILGDPGRKVPFVSCCVCIPNIYTIMGGLPWVVGEAVVIENVSILDGLSFPGALHRIWKTSPNISPLHLIPTSRLTSSDSTSTSYFIERFTFLNSICIMYLSPLCRQKSSHLGLGNNISKWS